MMDSLILRDAYVPQRDSVTFEVAEPHARSRGCVAWAMAEERGLACTVALSADDLAALRAWIDKVPL